MNTGDKVLVVVRAYVNDRGYPPSIGELGTSLGLSKTTIAYWLHKLRDQGRITFVDKQTRTLRLVEK